jgi:hypothetical protein
LDVGVDVVGGTVQLLRHHLAEIGSEPGVVAAEDAEDMQQALAVDPLLVKFCVPAGGAIGFITWRALIGLSSIGQPYLHHDLQNL